MAWTAPTADDVLSELTPAEAAKLQAILGGSTPEEKLAPILGRVVLEIQGDIKSGGYACDADPTKVPPGLLGAAVAIARWRFLITLPGAGAQLATDARKDANAAAMARMALVAQQKWSPEPPTAPANPSSGNWNSENKLIMRTHPVPQPSTQITETDTDYAKPPT